MKRFQNPPVSLQAGNEAPLRLRAGENTRCLKIWNTAVDRQDPGAVLACEMLLLAKAGVPV